MIDLPVSPGISKLIEMASIFSLTPYCIDYSETLGNQSAFFYASFIAS
jgi:hypothetical protein